MRRREKGVRKIDQIVEPTSGVGIDVYLRVEDGVFEAECSGVMFRKGDLGALRGEVLAHLRQAISLEWQDIIEVHFGSTWRSDDSLKIEIERVFIAARPAAAPLRAEVLASGYEEEDNDSRRLSRARPLGWDRKDRPFAPPCWDGRSMVAYLPYTPEVWQGLHELKAQIAQARKDLIQLLSTPSRAARLLEECGARVAAMVPRETEGRP